MKHSTFIALCLILFTGCQVSEKTANQPSNLSKQTEVSKKFSQVIIKEETGNPKIIVSSYTLITDNAEAHRADAEAVMRVKKNFPLAVMTKDRALFERILARNFVFRGEGENGLLRREDYINNRVQATGAIELVQYENMVLQFFGEIAVITYRNVLKNKDASGQPEDTEYISWADVYVKEDGEWKIGTAHIIDYRTEKQ
ncbi:MAG: nuclear transport factor 2 family protein [Acidobacteriota bacterium]|nr:nuclear transport factor 2 family protein [Acidobacteriota bacterium]